MSAPVTPAIDPARLAEIAAVPLSVGCHDDLDDGMCVMEAVAYVAGEAWSDAPACASPVIAAFLRAWNDNLPDAERDALLRPLIPRLIGTRGSPALEQRRSLMATDWLLREHTPAWLRLAGLTAHADTLAALPEITDMAQVLSIRGPIEAARRDTNAVGAAAWDAVGAAAWDAVGAAARAAARAAVGDAAWAAVGSAVGSAVGAAIGAALNPTRLALQRSALRLVERMIDAEVSLAKPAGHVS